MAEPDVGGLLLNKDSLDAAISPSRDEASFVVARYI